VWVSVIGNRGSAVFFLGVHLKAKPLFACDVGAETILCETEVAQLASFVVIECCETRGDVGCLLNSEECSILAIAVVVLHLFAGAEWAVLV
jgi:hypothetical protein